MKEGDRLTILTGGTAFHFGGAAPFVAAGIALPVFSASGRRRRGPVLEGPVRARLRHHRHRFNLMPTPAA